MTVVLPGSMTPEQTYKLLTGVVVPRPIAWITTLSTDGVVNLAPFSCFTFVSNAPPIARLGGPVYAGLGATTHMAPIGQTPKSVLTAETT